MIGPGARPVSPRPKAPQTSVWGKLAQARRVPPGSPIVDVILPVYRGYDDTLACIHSVLTSANKTPYELVIINDCSPESNLVSALEAIAAQGLIDLAHNDTNQGFVHTATMGMLRHPERDAILLNSDTIVHGNWIDRLHAHRLGIGKVGTITPWSNNATILSYPMTLENNDFDLEIDFAELDRLAANELAGEACDIPTGVGFCFYVSRECMDDTGTLNSREFGRGYGEENDFCLRAAARGWRNIAACDVFVRHTGEVSFRNDAVEARRLASAALLKLHPNYNELIASYIRADPLRPHRQKLDLARLKLWSGGQIVLLFEPGRSGDLQPPTEGLSSSVAEDGLHAVRVYPSQGDTESLVMNPIANLFLPNLPRLPTQDVAAAMRTIAAMGVARAHISSLRGYTPEQSKFVHQLCGKLCR